MTDTFVYNNNSIITTLSNTVSVTINLSSISAITIGNSTVNTQINASGFYVNSSPVGGSTATISFGNI